ncbi:D-alanine--D-alanine ligase [SAR86 cluster bacterium]|nr:D-alanine--D-alanine ligase [SAR86 cluster bacterium]
MKKNKDLNIGILYGGWSAEREISLKSGNSVYGTLIEEGFNCELIDLSSADIAFSKKTYEGLDLAFILVHGRGGEDGSLQNYLESISLPFTGSNSNSSKLAMDKVLTKTIWNKEKILNPNFFVYENNLDDILKLKGKVVVKPANEGSSFGISIIDNNKSDLEEAIRAASKYDKKVLIEKHIKGKELTVTILNDLAFDPIEVIPNSEYYDFEAKYLSKETIYQKAVLNAERLIYLKNQALLSFRSLGCSGWGRVDLIDDGNRFYFLEVNTVPGMTETSLVPKSAAFSGLTFNNLLEKILFKPIA